MKTGVLSALKELKSKHGSLQPDVVVAAAKKDARLHDCFDWSDSIAARKWRLHQARNLIRIMVEVEDIGGKEYQVRAFYSLPSDRQRGDGYRSRRDVMANEEWREELIQACLDQLNRTKEEYKILTELAALFSAIDEETEKRRAKAKSKGKPEVRPQA